MMDREFFCPNCKRRTVVCIDVRIVLCGCGYEMEELKGKDQRRRVEA